MPLDYIVEASTMQSMGIYTCLKAYVIEETPELSPPLPSRKRSQAGKGGKGQLDGSGPPLGPSDSLSALS